MLIKCELCKRKRAEKVERTDCTPFPKKRTQPVTFSKYKCKSIIDSPVRRYMMISMGSENTGLGLTVRSLRETKGMSRRELARAAGISESYLKKIENGHRNPGLETYQKITEVLDADIAIRNSDGTVKGECAARAHKVFLESTEKQAVFLVQVLEYMAETMKAAK